MEKNKKFQLKRIAISGFKTESKNVSLEFYEGNISVIYGENGVGKTTLLKILNAIFSQNESLLLEEKIKEITIDYSYNQINEKIKIRLIKEKISFDWSEFQKSNLFASSSILLGVQRGIQSKNIKVEPILIERIIKRNPQIRRKIDDTTLIERLSEEIAYTINKSRDIHGINKYSRGTIDLEDNHLFLENINIDTIEESLQKRYNQAKMITAARIQNALFDTLSLVINSPKEDLSFDNIAFEKKLLNSRIQLIEALQYSKNMIMYRVNEGNAQEEFINLLTHIDNEEIKSKILDNLTLKRLFLKMITELENEKAILESLNTLIKTFNEFLIDNKELKVEQNKIYIKTDNGEHSLSELSSGERHLLTFLTITLIYGVSKDFIFIDEPEISLNMIWQRKLLPLLSEIAPETQIIVASHSPSLAKFNSGILCKLNIEKINGEKNEV
jgi:ABC-type lipoprotein export system ATPase subunit